MHDLNTNRKEISMLHNLHSFSLVSLPMLAVISVNCAYAQDIETISMPDPSHWPSLQQPDESEWKFEAGVGVIYGTEYEGSDNYRFMPIPNVSVNYKEGLFFAGIFDGVGTYPIQSENYKVGMSIGWEFGRKEDDDSDNLRGMGDIDTAMVANLMGEYSLGPIQISGKISRGNSDYGTTATLDVGTMFPVSEHLMVMTSISTTWADADHMQTYFGVSSAQSVRSGYRRYDAKSGFKSVGVSVGAIYDISEKWDVMFMFNGDKLLGDAEDSPITKEDIQPTIFLTTSYKF